MIDGDLSEEQIEQLFKYVCTNTGHRQWADPYPQRALWANL